MKMAKSSKLSKRVRRDALTPATTLKTRIKKRPRGKSFERGNGFGSATRWKPGQSGNPSGKPHNAEIGKAVRARLSEVAQHDKNKRTFAELLVDRWIEEGLNGNVAALASIADRAEGRPGVSSPGNGEENPLMILIASMDQRSAEIGPAEGSVRRQLPEGDGNGPSETE